MDYLKKYKKLLSVTEKTKKIYLKKILYMKVYQT